MIMRIPILKSILRNLDWFEEARRHHVTPDGSIFLGGTNHRLKKAGDWEESKHPRADNGQFGSGSGGGSGSKKPSKTRRKMERREEAASQARVGGAIQSLLSGGSALDKIGWFKQPEKKPETPPPKPASKPRSKLPFMEKPEPEYLSIRDDDDLLTEYKRMVVQSHGPFASADARRAELGDELIRRGITEFKSPALVDPIKIRGTKGPAPKPKEEAAPAKEPTPQTDIKVEDGELAGSKILSLGNKRAGVIQHTDGSFVVLSQVDRKTVDRKEFKSLDEANGFAEGWLKGGQGVPKQQEKPKPKVSLADQATKLKLKDLKELPLGKLRSMQAALQKHPKFNNPAYPEGKKYDKALRMVEGAIYSKA